MKTRKLIPMIQFILEIDSMTTKEFCDTFNVPHPVFTGQVESSAKQFLQVDAIKQKMFVDYAKFLNKIITYDMFEGDKRIFDCGKYIDRQPSTNWNTYEVNGVVLFSDTNTERNVSRGLKVSDLTSLGIFYSER